LPKCVRSSRPVAPALAHPGVVALLCVAGLAGAAPPPDETLIVGAFSTTPPGKLPDGWRGLTFPAKNSHTMYTIIRDPELGNVIEAKAVASASGLTRPLEVDPRQWPFLRWRWKTSRLVANADLSRRDGDDFPLRIYVAFKADPGRLNLLERAWYAAAMLFYGSPPPQSGINYVWDGKAPAGTIAPNAYTSRVRMIVVESGAARLGQWVEYTRNIADDYRKAFGEEPPPIAGFAIMTDTDDTGDSVTSWYGDIALARAPR
jgi:hypothetical protein